MANGVHNNTKFDHGNSLLIIFDFTEFGVDDLLLLYLFNNLDKIKVERGISNNNRIFNYHTRYRLISKAIIY